MPHSNNPVTRDIADKRNGRPKTREKSSPQIAIARFGLTDPRLFTNYPTGWYTKVRAMRKDPTISLLRDLVIGPILASEWSIGHTDDAPAGAVDFVTKNVCNIRSYLVEHTLTGYMDFGWQAFEKIWAIDKNGQAIVDKIKPLLQDVTEILVDKDTGEFVGIIQTPQFDQIQESIRIGDDIVFGSGYLKAKDVILCNINVEGTYWYGRAIMENEIIPYDGWLDVNGAADIYDRKIAGSHWVVHYPLGSTVIDGTVTDNFELAQSIIQGLERSGAIAVPRSVDQVVDELNRETPDAWKIELMADTTSQQDNFVDRLKYYDALKARALGFPERSIQEGQFGTKAEAEVHSDAAVAIAEYRHTKLTEQISYQLVNDLLRYNYGSDSIGSVYLKAAPIADDVKLFLRQVYLTLMQHNPQVALEKINRKEIQERLGLPITIGDDDSSEFDFPDEDEVNSSPNNLNPMEGENTSDPLKRV